MTKTKTEQFPPGKSGFINATRRGFIQRSALVGGIAATGAVAVEAQSETPVAAFEPQTTAHAGYQLTDKVKEYYRRARF